MNTLFRLNEHFFATIDEHTSSKVIFNMFILLIIANIYLLTTQGESMLVENQTILATVIVAISVLGIYVVFMLGLSIFKILIENRFYQHLKRAIINKNIKDMQDIKDLMKSHNINKQQVLMVIYRLQEQAMIGKELAEYVVLLKALTKTYNEQEALENMPDALLYTLNKIKPQIQTTDMKNLTSQLQGIFSNDKRKMQIQYIFTLLGFVVGLFGLFNTAYKFI